MMIGAGSGLNRVKLGLPVEVVKSLERWELEARIPRHHFGRAQGPQVGAVAAENRADSDEGGRNPHQLVCPTGQQGKGRILSPRA